MEFPFVRTKSQRNTSDKGSFARGAGPDVLAEYAAWHAAKGYWPNETPLGQMTG